MSDSSWRFGQQELVYIKRGARLGLWRSYQRLERAFARRFGVRYAITHCNSTATMHSALAAAGGAGPVGAAGRLGSVKI
ncbi:MAG: DegT/DnrJ/EryC1/StrS family aminotransferase [Chloroflexota bacterium]